MGRAWGAVGDCHGSGEPGLKAAYAVADAVLYEGYLLYPYRRSSAKNKVRWQFGVLAPRAWVESNGTADGTVAGSAEAWRARTECLLEALDRAVLEARVRFLRPVHRRVERRNEDGSYRPVDAVETNGRRHVTFDEAEPQEFKLRAGVGELRGSPRRIEVALPGGEDVEPLGDGARVARRRAPISAAIGLSVEPADAPFPLLRARLTVHNTAPGAPALPRAEALRTSLVATHALLKVHDGGFLSLLEPPEWATAAAKACRNEHTFPVLAGAPGERDVMLSTPILMYDYPSVSPESPGNLFDAAEIDEILSLRALTLTEEEKQEARATDPKAAAIVDRIDDMPPEIFARLHGAVRSLRPVGEAAADSVLVDGTEVTVGSTVRLRPRAHGTDAQDMFLAGRTARVAQVLCDVDGTRYVGVTVSDAADEPADEPRDRYGRYFQFRPDELEPLRGDSQWTPSNC